MTKFVPQYAATMIVCPSSLGGQSVISSSNSRGLSNIASAFGLGASPGGSTTSFDRLTVLLGAVTLARRLQQKHQLLQRVKRNSWDEESRTWKRPSGERFERMQRVRAFFNLRTWRAPSISSLAGYLGSKVEVDDMEGTGFRKISVTDSDPEFARYLLETVYFEADDLLRDQDQESTLAHRGYLRDKVEAANIVEIRAGLVGLLMQQENKVMMHESELPYAASIIEPVNVSNQPTEPTPRL